MASEVRVDSLKNRSGLGTVTYTNTGAIVSGVVTANSFSGDGSQLSGIDSSALSSGGGVKVQANNSGAVVTGILTVGNNFLKGNSVGVGTTTAAGRDAGISTSTGEIIYDKHVGLQVYTGDADSNFLGGWKTISNTAAVGRFDGQGGTVISSGGYTYHVYTTGAATFTSPNNSAHYPTTIDFVLVAGGGSGGRYAWSAGAGGAGGVVHGENYVLTSGGTHPVTIGAGAPAPTSGPVLGINGSDSTFVIGGTTITAKGGGGGGGYVYPGYTAPLSAGQAGGSGGGGSGSDNSGAQNNPGPATQPTQNPGVANITNYGSLGGAYSPRANGYGGGAGGGAAGNGEASRDASNFPDGLDGAKGGAGRPFSGFPAPVLAPAIPSPTRSAWTTAVGPTGLFGGGGSASTSPGNTPEPASGGGTPRAPGGGGAGGYTSAQPEHADRDGVANTGGGGGACGDGVNAQSGAGGSGILIIRYTS